MTPIEQRAIKVLYRCTFLPGSFDKKIVATWYGWLETQPGREMSEKGKRLLWKLVYKYRRQIPDDSLILHALAEGALKS